MIRLLVAVVFCVLLTGCDGASNGAPQPFFRSPLDSGSKTLWSLDVHVQNNPTLATLKDIRNRLNADMIRIDYEPAAGHAFYDQLVSNAAATGLQIDFLTPYPAPPYDPNAYAQIVQAAAQRYAGQHLTWEMINEPDFYVPGMSLAQCIALETAAAKAIRAADPGATILTGGTSGRDSGNGFIYMVSLGQALAPYIDGVGVHPYGIAPSGFASIAAQISYKTGKPSYLTEWSTTNATDLMEAMISSRGYTPMFDSYEYEDGPGDQKYGLINNGLWTTFAAQAAP